MKNKIKYILAIISKIKDSLISLIRVLLFSKYNVGIKSIKDNGECYILGNGPSLKNDLIDKAEFLKSQKLFVVNDFSKSPYFEILKPQYYVFADPSYWNVGVFSDACRLILYHIRDKTDWPLIILIPNSAFNTQIFQTTFQSNPYIKIIDFNDASVSGFENFSFFLYKNYLGIPPMKNVLIACIYLANNMGLSELNILGADHSWTKDLMVNDNNEVCLADMHFYDKTKVDYVPIRHVYGYIYKMHQILRDFAQMFESYHLLRRYTDSFDTKVYNKCPNSFIDAFERKDFNV